MKWKLLATTALISYCSVMSAHAAGYGNSPSGATPMAPIPGTQMAPGNAQVMPQGSAPGAAQSGTGTGNVTNNNGSGAITSPGGADASAPTSGTGSITSPSGNVSITDDGGSLRMAPAGSGTSPVQAPVSNGVQQTQQTPQQTQQTPQQTQQMPQQTQQKPQSNQQMPQQNQQMQMPMNPNQTMVPTAPMSNSITQPNTGSMQN